MGRLPMNCETTPKSLICVLEFTKEESRKAVKEIIDKNF